MKELNKREKQIRCVELRNFSASENGGEMLLEGYAAVFEKPTVVCEYDGIEYKEVIDRKAFENADFSACCMKYNHEDCVPILSRVRGGFMSLSVDDFGLKFSAKFFNTTVAKDIYQIVKEGGLDKCSFAFTVKNESYDSSLRTRRILEIDKVLDVSIVDMPAYEDTNVVAMRSYFKAEAEKEQNLAEAEILKRKRAIAKTYL